MVFSRWKGRVGFHHCLLKAELSVGMRSGGEGARKEKKKLANPSRGLPRLVSKLQSDLRQKYFAVPQAWEQTSEQANKKKRTSAAERSSKASGASELFFLFSFCCK